MKISKGAWIGLVCVLIWIVVVILGSKYCNWNPACGGAIKPDFFCQAGGAFFYLPAWILLSPFLMLPFPWFVSLFLAVVFVAVCGFLLGSLIEKFLHFFRKKS